MGPIHLSLHHIQIAAPAGCEDDARRFYGGVLGLDEIEKPEQLQQQGGCWFRCGGHQIHIGVEPDFRPARKAHAAFAAVNLETLRTRLLARGFRVTDDSNLPGVRRFYTSDPWGNRIEFIEQPSEPG
ncbi:MAG TPA: VOC family protein [Bryobacteraceae bacterium]|nr:VOC family protein [Bryobacteraceae bacterium]